MKEGKEVKKLLYVIATRGKNGKEIYLSIDEERSKNEYNKIYYKWSENVKDAYSDISGYDIEDFARNYFVYFNKWYITCYYVNVE